MKESIRILVVGDAGVGKSSMISTYISRHFPEEVPPVMTEAVIPPEITSSGVSVTIMDSSAKATDKDVLLHKIIAADAILALYDVTRMETMDSLARYWLPLINNMSTSRLKPIVIVGQKSDLRGEQDSDIQSLELEKLGHLMQQFSNILSMDRCSSLQLYRLDHVFYMAELFVSCPIYPIFDNISGMLTSDCKRAFSHIFRIFDRDGDNLLSDHELSTIQKRCFDTTMIAAEATEWINQIAAHDKNGIVDSKVTLSGFLSGMKLFVLASMLQTPWAILRKFNYNDDLVLEVPDEVERIPSLQRDQYHTLSAEAIEFLQQLVVTCHENVRKNGERSNNTDDDEIVMIGTSEVFEGNEWHSESDKMNWSVLNQALSVMDSNVAHPWRELPYYQETEDNDYEPLHTLFFPGMPLGDRWTCNISSWILHWHMLAIFKPILTQELLYRLGYVDRSDLGVVTTCRRSDKSYYKKISTRTVVNTMVLGSNSTSKHRLIHLIQESSMLTNNHSNNGSRRECDSNSECNSRNTSIASLSPKSYTSGSNASVEYAYNGGSGIEENSGVLSSACFVSRMPESIHSQNNGNSNGSVVVRSGSSSSSIATKATTTLVATSVSDNLTQKWIDKYGDSVDLAVLMVDLNDECSFEEAKSYESLLPSSCPRVYATILDSFNSDEGKSGASPLINGDLHLRVNAYLKGNELPELFTLPDFTPFSSERHESSTLWSLFHHHLTSIVHVSETQKRVQETGIISSLISFVGSPTFIPVSLLFTGLGYGLYFMRNRYRWVAEYELWVWKEIQKLLLLSTKLLRFPSARITK